jgi:uncharacterized membrane-anchored protein YhcB (DUF1043 family)
MDAITPQVLMPLVAAAALVLGIVLGRIGRPARKKIEELETGLAERDARIDHLEAARSELAAHREELGLRLIAAEQERDDSREQLSRYQAQVVNHFTQTSDLLREMTLQYRSIYQHLAEGAEALCPEGVPRLATDTPIDSLPGAVPAEGNGNGSSAGRSQDDAEEPRAVRQDDAEEPRAVRQDDAEEPRAVRQDEDPQESLSAARSDPPLQVDARPEA